MSCLPWTWLAAHYSSLFQINLHLPNYFTKTDSFPCPPWPRSRQKFKRRHTWEGSSNKKLNIRSSTPQTMGPTGGSRWRTASSCSCFWASALWRLAAALMAPSSSRSSPRIRVSRLLKPGEGCKKCKIVRDVAKWWMDWNVLNILTWMDVE